MLAPEAYVAHHGEKMIYTITRRAFYLSEFYSTDIALFLHCLSSLNNFFLENEWTEANSVINPRDKTENRR